VRVTHLQPKFIEEVPDLLAEGVLYISMEYATTLHLCCCGCGNEVVLPLRPTAWQLYYDGQAISLSPSVGNWSFPCRSHYWIRGGSIQWARGWTDDQVNAGRRRTLQQRGIVAVDASPSPAPSWWRRFPTSLLDFFRRNR
jgi:Family of unknown function (DUF6527)